MAIRLTRRPFKIGTSQAISLPLDWFRFYADRLSTVTIVGDDILLLVPVGFENKAQRILDMMESEKK
jgi:virulence-associated protein VagC